MDQQELYDRQLQGIAGANAPGIALGEREAALLGWICSRIGGTASKSDVRFAELSIGDGQLSRALVRTLPSVTVDCVDISPSRLEHSRQLALAESASMAGRMRFLELNLDTDFGRLERGRYDAIVAIDVLEHVFDVFGFVRHCSEMLTPGGWLFLRVPNIAYFKRRFEVLAGRLPITSSWFDTLGSFRSWKERYGWDGGHLHFFTIDALRWLLEEEGFQALAWRDVGARAESVRRVWPGMLFGNIAVSARKPRKLSDAPAR
jgi:cyclopropane fatty-acyl-phospholipid synthase-like methyltransferase